MGTVGSDPSWYTSKGRFPVRIYGEWIEFGCSRGFCCLERQTERKFEGRGRQFKVAVRFYLRSYFNFAFVCQASIWSCFVSWIYINFHNIFISNLNVYGDNHLSLGAVLWSRSLKIIFLWAVKDIEDWQYGSQHVFIGFCFIFIRKRIIFIKTFLPAFPAFPSIIQPSPKHCKSPSRLTSIGFLIAAMSRGMLSKEDVIAS